MTDRPDPFQLWQQAQSGGGTADERGRRYADLMREHGHLMERQPDDDAPLFDCGYDPKAPMEAAEPDDPPVDYDG